MSLQINDIKNAIINGKTVLGIELGSILGHGGLFKTKDVGQKIRLINI